MLNPFKRFMKKSSTHVTSTVSCPVHEDTHESEVYDQRIGVIFKNYGVVDAIVVIGTKNTVLNAPIQLYNQIHIPHTLYKTQEHIEVCIDTYIKNLSAHKIAEIRSCNVVLSCI